MNAHGKRKAKSFVFRVLSICERFQNWIPDPESFFALNERTQKELYWYDVLCEDIKNLDMSELVLAIQKSMIPSAPSLRN